MSISPKQRKWLLISGGIVTGVFVLMLVVFALLNVSGGNASATPEPALQSGFFAVPGSDDGGDAFYEAEAPAADPAMDRADVMPDESLIATGDSVDNDQQAAVDRLIIRTGSITVAVEDTLASRKAIEDMVEQLAGEGAFVVSVNESGSNRGADPYISMSIRIPAARFDEVMGKVAEMAVEGTTPTQSQSAKDVTNQYVDLDARLETLEAARQRLLEIMLEAQNAQDLLYAEQQLTQREAEIASIKGQMQYLSQSAALSSISISLEPYILSQPVDGTWRPAETVRRAWEALLDSLRDFGDFVIYMGIACLPWLVILGLIIYGVVRLVRWRLRKSQGKNTAGQQTD